MVVYRKNIGNNIKEKTILEMVKYQEEKLFDKV